MQIIDGVYFTVNTVSTLFPFKNNPRRGYCERLVWYMHLIVKVGS